jgi:hypothetical protein
MGILLYNLLPRLYVLMLSQVTCNTGITLESAFELGAIVQGERG